MLAQVNLNAAAIIPSLANVDGILTTGEAARALGISRSTIVKLINDGLLPALRLGKSKRTHHRVSSDALKAYVEQAACIR